MKCQDCLYWQISDRTRMRGHVVAMRQDQDMQNVTGRQMALSWIAWPRTKASDWCGEFKKGMEPNQPSIRESGRA